jgi:hypothetical protein
VLYAAFVSAIIEMRVDSVEDGNAHECGAEKSHLSLPVRGEKSDQRTPEYRRTVSNSFRDAEKKRPRNLEGRAGPKDYGRGDQASAHT